MSTKYPTTTNSATSGSPAVLRSRSAKLKFLLLLCTAMFTTASSCDGTDTTKVDGPVELQFSAFDNQDCVFTYVDSGGAQEQASFSFIELNAPGSESPPNSLSITYGSLPDFDSGEIFLFPPPGNVTLVTLDPSDVDYPSWSMSVDLGGSNTINGGGAWSIRFSGGDITLCSQATPVVEVELIP